MKKFRMLLLTVIILLAITACGKSQNTLTGTYEIVSVKVDGSTFTIAELEAMDDDSMSNMVLVLKEGGKACIIQNEDSEIFDWEKIEGGVKIGIRGCEIVDDLICADIEDDMSVFFKKVSDSQMITAEKDEKEDADKSEDKEAADDSVKENSNKTDTKTEESDTFEELSATITKDIDDTVGALNTEYETLITELDSYEKYAENVTKVEEFYEKIVKDTEELCIRLREYSANYADIILGSDKSFDDKYEEFEELYDVIYDDARERIYDEIYDDLRDDMYDAFYDGIVSDGIDLVAYSEWSDMSSDAYRMWSDTGSEVYGFWSDAGTDIYRFWSDMRSEMYGDDMERAQKKLADFKEDIDKLKSK